MTKTFTHSLADELRATAEALERPFLRMAAGEWTYGAVDCDSDRVAAGLFAQGVRRGHKKFRLQQLGSAGAWDREAAPEA